MMRSENPKSTGLNSGFSLLELFITLGILTLIGVGIATIMKRQMEAAQYNTARDNTQSEVERVFSDISNSWLSRRQTANSLGYAISPEGSDVNNSLLIIMSQKNAAAASPRAFAMWRTVCRPIPAELNLATGVVNSLATMTAATCGVTCPVGARPVIEFKRGIQGDFNGDGAIDDLDFTVNPLPGNILLIPADWKSGPSRESLLGLGACFSRGASVAVTFQSAFLASKEQLQVQTRRVELRFETEYGSGVEVLR